MGKDQGGNDLAGQPGKVLIVPARAHTTQGGRSRRCQHTTACAAHGSTHCLCCSDGTQDCASGSRMQAACRQPLMPCCCCLPGRCDALVHAGRGVTLPQVIRRIPADAKPVPVEVAKPEVVGQGGVLQALPGVIRLLDDGPVRPCSVESGGAATGNGPQHAAWGLLATGRAATAHMLVHGLLLLLDQPQTKAATVQLLTQHHISNEPGGPYVGHQPAHRGCPFCWDCYCCCAVGMPLSNHSAVPISLRQSELLSGSRDTRSSDSLRNLQHLLCCPAAAVAEALLRNAKLSISPQEFCIVLMNTVCLVLQTASLAK